ncbi:unnamed protein product [Cuscuta campestris]|uniref:Uncharacterized protein n=1 Tax=Cuscuta campestris TaxID=132261 RepID=A0A484LVD1_9ASTE|nr:unnamed protein product [Cuscuta campestris]
MRRDPFTGRVFHYGSWVWRVESGGEGTSQAHEAAGRGVPSPGNTAEAEGWNHPGEIGPYAVEQLGMGSPSEVARLKKENEEMGFILKSQANELTRLSGMAGALKAEVSQLKEENGRLMDEVSEAKREMAEKEETFPGRAAAWVEENKADAARVMTATPEATMESFRFLYREPEGRKMITAIGSFGSRAREMAEKEETFPGRAAAWVEENKADAARVMTATPEATMESFRFLYREPEGRKMITAIGSFGFKSGQKKDRIASHRVLLRRDPEFSAASYGLAPIPKEEPTPPFPLE